MTNIKLKRVEQMNGSRMKDMEWIMNDKHAKSKFQGVSPVEMAWIHATLSEYTT